MPQNRSFGAKLPQVRGGTAPCWKCWGKAHPGPSGPLSLPSLQPAAVGPDALHAESPGASRNPDAQAASPKLITSEGWGGRSEGGTGA